jgi:hypothetical protein
MLVEHTHPKGVYWFVARTSYIRFSVTTELYIYVGASPNIINKIVTTTESIPLVDL